MQELLQRIKDSHPKYLTYDEAKTRQVIILPILQKLGWDIFEGEEVYPEYGVAGKRVDFSLRIDNKNCFFIEVKKCSVDLNAHQEQLLGYSFREGVSLACLTNGITWQFFLPLIEGSWENRLFYTINIEKQDVEEIYSVFNKVLHKDAVASKKAVQNAESLQHDNFKSIILRKSIPEVWESLLLTPTDAFINLILDKVENHCGHRPSSEEICQYLLEYNKHKHYITNDSIDKTPKRVYISHLTTENNTTIDRSYVIIRGQKIYSEPIPGQSKDYITNILPQLLAVLPQFEIENLQNVAYCHRVGISGKQYPIMSKRKEEMVGDDKRFRAYQHQISGFWVTAQWTAYFPAWKIYLQNLERTLG